MTIRIPTERVGQEFNLGNATLYQDDSPEARAYLAVKRSEAKIDVAKPVPGYPKAGGHGSGTIVTSDGILVTDRHCVVDDDGTPFSDEKITVTVEGKQYHARVLTDAHNLGIRSDQAALQIIAPDGQTFVPLRIASGIRPGSQQWVFGYPQNSNELFMSPVEAATANNPDGETTRAVLANNGAALTPGEDPNRRLHRSPVHIEPGNSGGARVQIGADGQPELVELADITNADVRAQLAAAQELQTDAALHLRDTDTVNWKDDRGHSHSGLYKDRRAYLETIRNAPSAGWFTPREEVVAFLDDVTGRRFGERRDVGPPGSGVDWSRGQLADRRPVTGRVESGEATTRDQYGTIAEHILAAHAKSSVESYYLKQFMG